MTSKSAAQQLNLPAPIDDYPPDIAILGEPISKFEYHTRRAHLVPFIGHHMAKIREVLDTIARLTFNDIEARIGVVHSTIVPDLKKARAAWEIVAWNQMIRPFDHPSREYHFDPAPYIKAMEKDPDSLYMYGVYIIKKPDVSLYRKIKNLHPDTARQYFNYARSYAVARAEFEPIGWLTNW